MERHSSTGLPFSHSVAKDDDAVKRFMTMLTISWLLLLPPPLLLLLLLLLLLPLLQHQNKLLRTLTNATSYKDIITSARILPIALPHPKVLNFASTITPFESTSICNFMTSPQAGAPTRPGNASF